jgi:hypothetical protein
MPKGLDLTADPPVTAGNRFDAAYGGYATLYCATERYGALLEKLAPLRRIPDLPARIEQALAGSADLQHDRQPGAAGFPADIFDTLQMGSVLLDPNDLFVDVDHPETHASLEKHGGRPLLEQLRLTRIDRGTFLAPDRRLTRLAAHEIHELVGGLAGGLRYTSALDPNVECWAIWEHARPRLRNHDVEPIDVRSPDVQRVIPRLGFHVAD